MNHSPRINRMKHTPWMPLLVIAIQGFALSCASEPTPSEPSPRSAPSPLQPQAPAAKPPVALKEKRPMLTIDRIYDSKDFSEEKLGQFVWSKKRPGYFTLAAPATGGGGGQDLVWNDAAGPAKEIILPAHAFIPPGGSQPLSIESFSFSEDESKLLISTNSKRVWRQNSRGDYWVIDLASRQLIKLGGDAAPSTLMFARFSPDGGQVAFVRENNIYLQRLLDLRITPLTTDGSARLINGTADWAYEEELDLREAYRWSPDGQSIAYWQFNTTGVPEHLLINNTDGLYSRAIPIPYPKVGQRNSAVRVGVVPASGGPTRWLDLPGDPRNHYIARMEWTPDASRLLIQRFNRLQNTNKVMLADPQSGQSTLVHIETDEAWLENENPVRWLDKGARFLWLSERDGWRHAYLADLKGSSLAPVTSGQFDVLAVEAIDEPNQRLYYAASPDNPTQRYLFSAPLDGSKPVRLTPQNQPGWHTYNISTDSQWALHTYSTFTSPPTIELIRLPTHETVRVLVENKKLRETLADLKPTSSEFLRVDIGDGNLLDAWCIKPPDFDPAAKYPLLFYVYGEPHGQTVCDRWPGQRGLWHQMLAQQGYLVASVDNRGVMSPRGRQWRKMVYRQVGILSPEDQAAAARALLKLWPYADPARVGIWGYSGGGSSSLHAIFRYPDLYRTAMAVASVPNQRLYDSIYQERYMGSPEDNAEGYRRGSPITHAAGLKGNLLIVHGTGDDNCHYQGVEMLINELIAQNKAFTVMPYPNRTHALSEGPNTTRHLHSLLTRYLHEHLPPNPPAAPPPPTKP